MKKIFSGIALLGVFAFASAQTITFDKEVIDYGKVAVGSDGSRVFTIKNTGDKPLIISNVQSSCGCTIPKWTNDPILPGKTGSITVTYDTKRIGPIQKVIQVSSNDPVNGNSVVHIKGEVLPEGASLTSSSAVVQSPTLQTARVEAKALPIETKAEAKKAKKAATK